MSNKRIIFFLIFSFQSVDIRSMLRFFCDLLSSKSAYLYYDNKTQAKRYFQLEVFLIN